MEKLALEFVQKMLRLYFEERNLNVIVSYLDSVVTWIGFGKNESCTSYENAIKALQKEGQLYHGSFTIQKSHLFVQNNNNGIFTVYGSMTIRENSTEQDMADIDVRLTAVCRTSANGMKLCHVHLSQPSEDQRDDQFFPVLFSNQTGYLRKLLDEKHPHSRRATLTCRLLLIIFPEAYSVACLMKSSPYFMSATDLFPCLGIQEKKLKINSETAFGK